jgi:hypothetical protein
VSEEDRSQQSGDWSGRVLSGLGGCGPMFVGLTGTESEFTARFTNYLRGNSGFFMHKFRKKFQIPGKCFKNRKKENFPAAYEASLAKKLQKRADFVKISRN